MKSLVHWCTGALVYCGSAPLRRIPSFGGHLPTYEIPCALVHWCTGVLRQCTIAPYSLFWRSRALGNAVSQGRPRLTFPSRRFVPWHGLLGGPGSNKILGLRCHSDIEGLVLVLSHGTEYD